MILRESFSIVTAAVGVAVSTGCVLFSRKFLPLSETPKINPFRFVMYVLFLIGQVYVAGFSAIKIILTGAHVEIARVKTKVSSLFLRTVLVNSITLVPGSVSLDLKDDEITVLWLTEKTAKSAQTKSADEVILGKLERMLLKVQK